MSEELKRGLVRAARTVAAVALSAAINAAIDAALGIIETDPVFQTGRIAVVASVIAAVAKLLRSQGILPVKVLL